MNDVTETLDFNNHEDTSTKTYDSKGFSELKELYPIDSTKTGDHANYRFYARVEVEVGLLKSSVLIITHQGDKWYTDVGGVKSEVTETMIKTNLALTFGFFVPVEPNGTLSHSESMKELDNIEHQRLHINGYSRGTDSNVAHNVASTIAFAEQKLISYRIEENMVEGEAIKSTTTFDLRFN